MPATRSTAMHLMVRPASVGRVGPPSRCSHRKGLLDSQLPDRPASAAAAVADRDEREEPLGWNGTVPASAPATAS
jgi:hypothetical protein